MSLRFLLGGAGSGKTCRLVKQVLEEAGCHPEERYIILVPEQYTMQLQRQVVEMHPSHGIMNIDVLSFERTAYRIMGEKAVSYRILEETGKNMLLRLALRDCSRSFKVFGKQVGRAGFVTRLKSMISELQQYHISPDQLQELLAQEGMTPLLKGKLEDLQTAYRAFEERFPEQTMTAEELLPRLALLLPESDYFKGTHIYADGFTGFTHVQYEILQEILRQCRDFEIALTLRSREAEGFSTHELFALTKETVQRLGELGIRAGHEIDKVYLPDSEWRKPGLQHLERYILDYGKLPQYVGADSGVSLWQCRSPKEEAERTAAEIFRLVCEEGYRFREIAVVTGDEDTYFPYLKQVLEEGNIAYFTDRTQGLARHPLIQMITAACQAVCGGCDRDSVLRYLKCGLTQADREDIDELENYALAHGFRRGKIWAEEWEQASEDAEYREHINQIRSRCLGELLNFQAAVQNVSQVTEYNQALRVLLQQPELEEKLKLQAERLQKAGKDRDSQVWEQVLTAAVEFLDQMDAFIGSMEMSMAVYSDVLKAGLEELKVGILPSGLDQVMLGDVERSRLGNIRVLFFLGVNEGLVPKSRSGGGILSEKEREILESLHIELAPSAVRASENERFYIYRLLTKPEERLYVSHSLSGRTGEGLRVSYVWKQLAELFPAAADAEMKKDPEESTNGKIYNRQTALRFMADELGSGADRVFWNDLYKILRRDKDTRSRLGTILAGAFASYKEVQLSPEAVDGIYGQILSGSISRLEKFAGCPYDHFLSYGLNLQPRREWTLAGTDRGNFFHEALEFMLRRASVDEQGKPKENWAELAPEKRKELVREAVHYAEERMGATALGDKEAHQYYIKRWERILDRTLWAVCEQMKKGQFTPAAFECRFRGDDLKGLSFPLEIGGRLDMNGIIDRIDVCEEEDGLYLRIVDYKTAEQKFDLTKFYYGLQLQLMIYMKAAEEIYQRQNKAEDGKVRASGMFYYNIDDPLIKNDKGYTNEMVEAEILKALRMQGLLCAEDTDYHEDVAGEKVSRQVLNLMEDYAAHKARDLGNRIMSGQISVKPYELNKKSACDYCPYACVCQFDPKIRGFRGASLQEKKIEEFIKEMEEGGRSEDEQGTEPDGPDGNETDNA